MQIPGALLHPALYVLYPLSLSAKRLSEKVGFGEAHTPSKTKTSRTLRKMQHIENHVNTFARVKITRRSRVKKKQC